MKKFLALVLAVLTLTAALGGCGNTAAPGTSGNDAPVSTPDASEPDSDTGNSGNAVVTTSLPGTFEIAATDPHYIIATPTGTPRATAAASPSPKTAAIPTPL